MKKLISLALALLMVLSMIPASAETAYTQAPYLDGMDLTLALACISSTCFSLSDVETVTIHAPAGSFDRPVLFTAYRDSFLLYDDTTTPPDADDAS